MCLVVLEARCVPPRTRMQPVCTCHQCSFGTRHSLGVSASRHAALYIIPSSIGPYIRDAKGSSSGKGISLHAMGDQVRVRFKGDHKYVEDLDTRIDAPELVSLAFYPLMGH